MGPSKDPFETVLDPFWDHLGHLGLLKQKRSKKILEINKQEQKVQKTKTKTAHRSWPGGMREAIK